LENAMDLSYDYVMMMMDDDDDDDNFQIPFGVPFVYPKPKLSYGKALLDYQVFNTNLHYKLNCH